MISSITYIDTLKRVLILIHLHRKIQEKLLKTIISFEYISFQGNEQKQNLLANLILNA